ncbi:MAG: type II toxin-antitoxin system HipA family toxin [Alteromonadaceae bacterium]|nr:type II toxin-antitoxin system HipA family toxin [Alteromonadaceae bacterium]
MTSKAFVFIDGLEPTPVVAGVTEVDDTRGVGRFRYGKSYLARKDAFALDPLNLPLSTDEYRTTLGQGLFGVLSDAGADSWGNKVILALHSTKPKNKLEFLLAGAGMGVGALVFSLSSSQSKPKYNKNTLGDLPVLFKAKDAILADKAIPQEAKKVVEFGASMGGARPKTTIVDGTTSYLVKFNRPDDLFNVVKVEHATMSMLSELPCRVAKTKVISGGVGDALLVERFDVVGNKPACHFISANALLNTKKVSEALLTTHYTYGQLAEYLRKISAEPTDANELYTRMVFNVLIGNTDDHARNHAFVFDFPNRQWRLSQAYDVLPINNRRIHSLGLGENGREGTIDNLLSQSVRFGLKPFKARRIVSHVQELVAQWPAYFRQHGVGEGDIERLRAVIPTIS